MTITIPRAFGSVLILTVTPPAAAPTPNVTWVTRDNKATWKTRDNTITWKTRG